MSSMSSEGLSSREQRRLDREERKRAENASVEQRKQDRTERKRQRTSQTTSNVNSVKKTPVKTDRQNMSATKNTSTGGQRKQSSSSTKRATVGSYDKVNIIEKTAKFDSVEKENKGKSNSEEKKPQRSDSTRRKLGSKFLDNLSKFESQAKQQNEKGTPFVRSYSKNHTTAVAEPSFRRSYRPSRTPSVEVDSSNLARRSLRKERVLDSISKFERKSSNDGEGSKRKPSSPNDKKCSRPSSASSSKASLSDSGSTSSTSSVKGMTRAQQALERHKMRMRSSSQSSQNGSTTPTKPSSPSGKVRSNDSFRKPPKTPKSRSKDAKTPVNEKTRKISVTTTPVDGDAVQVTTVTEVTTPSEGTMSVIVKEIAISEEETEKLLSPVDGEYKLGDPRPKSVEETAAEFDKGLSLDGISDPPSVRRKLLTNQEVESKSSRQSGSSEGTDFKLEENVVVIETSPTFKDSEILDSQSPSSDQNFHFSHNFNSNSNTDPKSREQNLLIRDEEIAMEVEPMKRDSTKTVQEQIHGIEKRSFSSDEAIEVLRRLSEEIHSPPTVTKDKSCDPSNEVIHEETEVGEDSATSRVETKREKRPASLHIEEVLYITKEPERRPKSSSPLKQFVNWSPVQHKSSVKLKKFSFESFQKSPEAAEPAKSIEETPRTPSPVTITDTTTEVPTSADSETRSPSPVIEPEAPETVNKAKSPEVQNKIETAEPTENLSSPIKPQQPSSEIVSPAPAESLPEPPKRAVSPGKQAQSPIKESLSDPKTDPVFPSKKVLPTPVPLPTDCPKSPVTHLNSSKSPVNTTEPLSKEMLAAHTRNFTPRYKKSWLDESDDDNVSVLSDAASDASSIDLEWLGADSDAEDNFVPRNRKPSKTKKTSAVQRTASSAQDMLKMWEKKATEKKAENRASPSKAPVEPKKIGGVHAAWESKVNVQSRSSESIGNGHSVDEPSEKVTSTPSTPSRKPVVNDGSKGDDAKEMQEIFDDKVSGKIQGAKAMFENLNQSPKKSPSLRRSPRKRVEPLSHGSTEDSPIVSRKSSSSEIQVTSRKSSISQASESSDAARNDGSDELEDSPRVDNMRALFEQQTNRKPESKKLKTSTTGERKSRTPKSNIQKKVANRKKGRRSMTQPVTSEDVVKARGAMNGNSKSGLDTDEEEEELNFVDRLKFFNQLSKKTTTKTRVRRRSDTQPVKSSTITQASEIFEKKKSEGEGQIIRSPVRRSFVPSSPAKKTPPSSPLSKKPAAPLSPVKTSTSELKPIPVTSPRSPVASVQNLTQKFSLSSSSDNESLLSSSSTSIDGPDRDKKSLLLSSDETSSDMSVHVSEIKTSGSIHDRMKRLQKNQAEDKWKKQQRNSEVKSSVSERLNQLKKQDDKWKKSSHSEFVNRVDKLSDRITKMQEDSKTWMGKTGKQNDAAQFTVQAKIAKRDGKKAIAVLPSPVIKRKLPSAIVPSREVSVTTDDAKKTDDSSSMSKLSFVEKLANKGLEENVIKKTEVLTTEVPEIDQNEFEKFFGTSEGIEDTAGPELEELPEIENSTRLSDIGRLKFSLQQDSRRRSSKKRNPVKALSERTDLKQSYDTERLNVAKLEQQRIAVQRGHGANFTSAALAGLAAKADLKKVSLRSTKNTPMPSSDDLKPFNDVMLLRAKGRRQVQTRLVEPCPASLCSDDAFLLVTRDKLFGWFGEYCNVIERAKINEIADYIVIKGDLGCKVSALRTIEENANPDMHKDFWKLLGGRGDWSRTMTPGEDEQFEVDIESTIKTYKMIDSKLVPHEEAWGKFPKMAMLKSSDTYIFDFGAEMYIWQGKDVSFADRRLAVRLSRVLWEQDYDYTEQGVCPFHAKELKGKRPSYGLFARVNENLETSLFQEKFMDWSNIYREVGQEEAILVETNRGKALKENTNKADIAADLVACDVTKLRETEPSHAPLVIDGFDVALGDGDIVDEDGRILEIVTSKVEKYFISENKIENLPDSVLHHENSYVVKWCYSISSTGRFEKSRTPATAVSDSGNGRPRVAYFSWTGPDSAMNEKGVSALIATSMDTDDGPVLNLSDATTPLVFNKCFSGNLIVTNGKRGGKRSGFTWRLFRVKGSSPESAALVEVACNCWSLRSCSSFVAILPREAEAIVWNGCRSPKDSREAAETIVKKMNEQKPESILTKKTKPDLEITIAEEGEEPEKFWEAVGIKRRNRYGCLVGVDAETVATRSWKFVIESDVFTTDELRPVEGDSLLPLVQEQLTEIEKPCMVLVDCTHGTFLWQNCGSASLNGSAKRRWDVMKRLAMESTMSYCKVYNREEAVLIEAGSEPMSFTNAFPAWTKNEKNSLDRLVGTKPKRVSEIFSTLTQLTYTIEELRAKELPDGVDARHLESYLSNADFEKLFEMPKKDFYKLPAWKQVKLRQQKNLF